MIDDRFSDEFLRAELAKTGDPGRYFVVDDGICRLDERGQLWALIIEQDDLAAATVEYLRRLGQVRDQLPEVPIEFRLD